MTTETCDVLIIGSGGAGLRTAIELQENNVDVLVVGKCEKREAHTKMAQGGINAALGTMDPEDTWQQHAVDTIHDGGGLNDPTAVELLCKNAPDAIQELEEWGCSFAKEEDGRLLQRFFGAATYRRACFVGAHTGLAILNTLVDQVEKRKIRFDSEIYVFSLLTSDASSRLMSTVSSRLMSTVSSRLMSTVSSRAEPRDSHPIINGAIGLDLNSGEIIVFHAKAVVLATGGHSRMFARSSSHFWENNGDGIALAFGVGASFMDMEMFQFHPTGMLFPEEAEGLLVTEATRGEGGILTNALGERFMEKYDKERMELSARDIVARANYLEVKAGRGTKHGGVYLDISHKPKEYILERLPDIYENFQKYCGIDISKEKMEVGPTAHYSMGGLLVNHQTGEVLRCGAGSQPAQKSMCSSAAKVAAPQPIPHLYAVGEVGSGVHGGNRLGGNSLAEILVFGKLTGRHIAQSVAESRSSPLLEKQIQGKISWLETLQDSENGEDPITVKKEIQSAMWEGVGVVREETEMKKALKEIEKCKDTPLAVDPSNQESLLAALDVQNMLPTCDMIIQSAMMRTESRAAHTRRDYPEEDPKWQKNIICTPKDRKIALSTREVTSPSKEIAALLGKESTAQNHLLE